MTLSFLQSACAQARSAQPWAVSTLKHTMAMPGMRPKSTKEGSRTWPAWREGPCWSWWMGWCCYTFCGDLWLSHISWQTWRGIQRLVMVFIPRGDRYVRVFCWDCLPPPPPWEIYVICSSILKDFFLQVSFSSQRPVDPLFWLLPLTETVRRHTLNSCVWQVARLDYVAS